MDNDLFGVFICMELEKLIIVTTVGFESSFF